MHFSLPKLILQATRLTIFANIKTYNIITAYFTKKIYVVDKEITIEAHSDLSSLVLDFDTI